MKLMVDAPGPQLLGLRAEQLATNALVEVAGSADVRTYAGMAERAGQWSSALATVGIRSSETVMVMLRPSAEALAAWMGIANLGALEVPVNVEYKGEMLRHVVSNSAARVLITSSEFLPRFGRLPNQEDLAFCIVTDVTSEDDIVSGKFQVLHLASDIVDGAEPMPMTDAATWDDPASVIYTSGTTGPSKGVIVPWGELATIPTVFPEEYFTQESKIYSFWPMNHILGKWPFLGAIDRGATMCVRDRYRTPQFWKDVIQHDVSLAPIIGPIPQFLMNEPETDNDWDNPLKDVIMGPIIREFVEFEKRFGVRVHTASGMTETGLAFRDYHPLPNDKVGGKLWPGYHARLVDDEGRHLDAGKVGELWISADDPAWLFNGYLNNPDATERAWQDGWFRTGDNFRYDNDGNWYFVDRKKDSIRRRGENISSYEVEKEVNSHPAIAESAAVAVPSRFGEDELKVVVVLKSGMSVSPSSLSDYLSDHMPRFMVPRYIEIVSELPKTPTGKTRKVVLRDRGITDHDWDSEGQRYAAPQSS